MCIWRGGGGSSNRNANRDESVETGEESVETGHESVEAGEKTQQSCYNTSHATVIIQSTSSSTPILIQQIKLRSYEHWKSK